MSTVDEIERAVSASIPASVVSAREASSGHFEIRVVAAAFEGKTLLQKQRMVLSAIKHLMAGDHAPVHAVDRIETLVRE